MGRKNKTDYTIAGRPPKNPLEKVGRPIRALVTQPVVDAVQLSMARHNILLSDALRLALFRLLEADGLITPELATDDTWETLRGKGLV